MIESDNDSQNMIRNTDLLKQVNVMIENHNKIKKGIIHHYTKDYALGDRSRSFVGFGFKLSVS